MKAPPQSTMVSTSQLGVSPSLQPPNDNNSQFNGVRGLPVNSASGMLPSNSTGGAGVPPAGVHIPNQFTLGAN